MRIHVVDWHSFHFSRANKRVWTAVFHHRWQLWCVCVFFFLSPHENLPISAWTWMWSIENRLKMCRKKKVLTRNSFAFDLAEIRPSSLIFVFRLTVHVTRAKCCTLFFSNFYLPFFFSFVLFCLPLLTRSIVFFFPRFVEQLVHLMLSYFVERKTWLTRGCQTNGVKRQINLVKMKYLLHTEEIQNYYWP